MLSTYVIVLLFIIIVIILVVIAAVMLFWLAYIEPLRRRKKRSRSTSIHPLAQNLQAHLVKFFVKSELLLRRFFLSVTNQCRVKVIRHKHTSAKRPCRNSFSGSFIFC